MPRKAWVADILAAAKGNVEGISDVVKGDDDGDVNFCFTPDEGVPIEIALLAMDVSGYPSESSFMIFSRSSEIPPAVAVALEGIAQTSNGMGLLDLLSAISRKLNNILSKGERDLPSQVDGNSDVEESEDYDEDGEDEDADMYSDEDPAFESALTKDNTLITQRLSPENAAKLNRRIIEDLRVTKLAGYKISALVGMTAGCPHNIVSISVHVARLGLSEEVVQAWDLEPDQYIVILIRYSSGYKTFDSVISDPATSLEIAFRVGISNRYKPAQAEALAAFSENRAQAVESADVPDRAGIGAHAKAAGFSSLFISSSLNEFINEQFISLLKIRYAMGLSWDDAKKFYNDKRGRLDDQMAEHHPNPPHKTGAKGNGIEKSKENVPDMAVADHLGENIDYKFSFPLIAAQFAIRYLLRCTEFCLVCHEKLDHGFEALKPYVCDKPLCLYQYMSLGFGPSVEHEIYTQPYVVDLLVSFCYSSAMGRRIREYPTGMALLVPVILGNVTQKTTDSARGLTAPQPAPSPREASPTEMLNVKYDENKHEIVFDGPQTLSLRLGDWIVVSTGAGNAKRHYRVEDVSCYPTIKLSKDPIGLKKNSTIDTSTTADTDGQAPLTPVLLPASIAVYENNFDDLREEDKAESIVLLLDTLPPIKEMKNYLAQQGRSSEPSLRTWKQRISPAALGLLRWIIASNRSCIVQVDRCPGQAASELDTAKLRLDQRVLNIAHNWVQFRFAQGSPDKEQRFLQALTAQKDLLPNSYPTIFAFHGSPIQNWHSIIRSGLDFSQTLHGRAYGNGVYHATDQRTSIGYAMMGSVHMAWPGSELKPTAAMSLNEILNCPDQFASRNPHLVVQHVDWIQCRYLFVQSASSATSTASRTSVSVSNSPAPEGHDQVEQDPNHTAKSTEDTPIGVPKCATVISRAFRRGLEQDTNSSKRQKNLSSRLSTISIPYSEEEDPADIRFLLSDDDSSYIDGIGKAAGNLVLLNNFDSTNHTDFIPSSLDQSRLPLLDPPSYATSSATMRLSKELKTILDIQKHTPLHELGWFIDANLVTNVYQWIVELHSFDQSLPLAQDMKAAGVTSIVLEIRFGKEYPHSPPFVRVIRPRFLPFTRGGGGHVTGGGAMCMELLTNSGWSAVSSVESVLLQVRMAIMNLEPKPARLESIHKNHQMDYNTGEAMEAYIRACRAHGWEIPKDFGDFAGGSGRSP